MDSELKKIAKIGKMKISRIIRAARTGNLSMPESTFKDFFEKQGDCTKGISVGEAIKRVFAA